MNRTLKTMLAASLVLLAGCDGDARMVSDEQKMMDTVQKMQISQAAPSDIDYSLERYNLIKRAYWVNGMRERAASLPCRIQRPLGCIVLFSANGAVIGRFVVDGKVSSLNSFLTPESEMYEQRTGSSGGAWGNKWLPDADGAYGKNDDGIFFFTPDGKYLEWTGSYLYSDIPFEVKDPVLKIGGGL